MPQTALVGTDNNSNNQSIRGATKMTDMNAVTFTEPIAIADTFASGLADVEDLGDGNLRYTLYARRKSMDFPGVYDFEVVARIVMPSSAAMIGVRQTMQCLGYRCCGGEKLRRFAH